MPPCLPFTTPLAQCVYLPAETSRMSYRFFEELGADDFQQLLARGWRRFGEQFFRPSCPACAKCRSLRVRVADFVPGKSQRRVLRKNTGVRVEVRPATVTPEHVRLYNAYHSFMAAE